MHANIIEPVSSFYKVYPPHYASASVYSTVTSKTSLKDAAAVTPSGITPLLRKWFAPSRILAQRKAKRKTYNWMANTKVEIIFTIQISMGFCF